MTKEIADRMEAEEKNRLEAIALTGAKTMADAIRLVAGIGAPRVGRGILWEHSVTAALTAPLFYDQPMLFLCHHCGIVEQPGLLRRMAKDKLLLPVLNGCYHRFGPEVLGVLQAIPHVSTEARWKLENFRSRLLDDGCLCQECTREKIADFSGLQPEFKLEVEKYFIPRLAELPVSVRLILLSEVNKSIQVATSDAFRASTRRVERTVMLSRAEALEAIPQFDSSLAGGPAGPTGPEEVAFMANSLGIAYHPDLDPNRYLDVIKGYKGSLGFLVKNFEPASVKKAMATVDKINDEVDELSGSHRLKLLRLSTALFTRTRRRVIEGIIGGLVGTAAMGPAGTLMGVGAGALGAAAAVGVDAVVEPAAEVALDNISTSRFADQALARYFSKSLPAVQVWRMRSKFAALAAR